MGGRLSHAGRPGVREQGAPLFDVTSDSRDVSEWDAVRLHSVSRVSDESVRHSEVQPHVSGSSSGRTNGKLNLVSNARQAACCSAAIAERSCERRSRDSSIEARGA